MKKIAAFSLLIAVSLLSTGCKPSGTTVSKTIPIGYKGIAKSEPYLAAQRLLKELGNDARTIHSMQELPNHGATLILGGQGALSQTVGFRALDWVERQNGHLILMLRGTEPWRNDWDSKIGDLFSNSSELSIHPVLQKLGIKVVSSGIFSSAHSKDFHITLDGKQMEGESEMSVFMDASQQKQKVDYIEGTLEKSRLLSLPWKGGRITIVGDGTIFRNRYIDIKNHARLLVEMVALHSKSGWNSGNNENVFFLFGGNETLFSLLWEKYWMAVIGLACLILFWLWKNFPRFGPLAVDTTSSNRQFASHLKMTGAYLWKRRQTPDLLLPLRRAISQKLAVRHPALVESDEGRLMERLAEASGLPYNRVVAAWQAGHVNDSQSLLSVVRDLQIIEQSL